MAHSQSHRLGKGGGDGGPLERRGAPLDALGRPLRCCCSSDTSGTVLPMPTQTCMIGQRKLKAN